MGGKILGEARKHKDRDGKMLEFQEQLEPGEQ